MIKNYIKLLILSLLLSISTSVSASSFFGGSTGGGITGASTLAKYGPFTISPKNYITITHGSIINNTAIFQIIEGITFASDSYSSNYALSQPCNASNQAVSCTYAFNGDGIATAWGSCSSCTTNQWISSDLSNSYNIQQVGIQNFQSGSNADRSIATFKVQASTDNSTWVDITGTLTAANNTNVQLFQFSNSTAYRYWRVYVFTSYATGAGGTAIGAAEIQFMILSASAGTYYEIQTDGRADLSQTYTLPAWNTNDTAHAYGIRRMSATTTQIWKFSNNSASIYVNILY